MSGSWKLVVPDRGRGNRRSRSAGARSRGGTARARSQRDVRRVVPTASSRGWFLRRATSSTRSASRGSRGGPGWRQLRAAARAVTAPFAALRILGRRRPDVVLGGGGYVAGPVVLAAWLRAHPGGADRGGRASRAGEPARRPVRASASSSPTRSPAATARSTGSSAGPSRPRTWAASREAGRQRFGLPLDRPVVAVFGALAGARTLNEMARLRVGGRAGPPCCTSPASATTRRCVGRVAAIGLRPAAADRALRRRRSPPPTSPSRGRAGPCGSSRRPALRPSSCRIRMRRRITRR